MSQSPIIRFTGSPDSSPSDWLRINHLTHQPGPGSAYRITIEPLVPVEVEPPVWKMDTQFYGEKWLAGIPREAWCEETEADTALRFQNGTAAIGATREEALENLRKAKARGPL